MAVRETATPAGLSASSAVPNRDSSHPVRTCIGCRQKSAAAELLRVVAEPALPGSAPGATVRVVPDPGKSAAGRGASVHPDPNCVEQAQRRRAFARALKVRSADPAQVVAYVAQLSG